MAMALLMNRTQPERGLSSPQRATPAEERSRVAAPTRSRGAPSSHRFMIPMRDSRIMLNLTRLLLAVMFLGAVVWQYNLPGRTFFGLLAAPRTMFSVDEGWAAPPAVTTEPAKPAMVEVNATGSADGRIAMTPSSQLVHRQSRWLQSANDSASVANQGRGN